MEMPIVEGLVRYADENNVPFHMPGHKNNANNFQELEVIRHRLYDIDVTEVPGTDNLHCPEGIILEGEKKAAQCYGASKSYFLINGSTCGIYAMILACTNPGDNIIVQRDCHRAVHMACLLGGVNCSYVEPEIVPEFYITGGVSYDNIIKAIEKSPEAKAVVLTYPSYYGICSDIETIAKIVHERGMLLLVDSAHGAHFAFSDKLPKSSLSCGADAEVVSVHKSLPAMTQCSILNTTSAMDEDRVSFMLRMFETSSPSYVLMSSIDAARSIMQSRGEALLEQLIDEINEFKYMIKGLYPYRVLEKKDLINCSGFDMDATKIVIASSYGGYALEKALRQDYGIQVEMSDYKNIVAIGTVGDNKNAYKRLYRALYELQGKLPEYHVPEISSKYPEHNTVMSMRSAYYSAKEKILLKDAEGRISSEIAAPYPPGIPVLLPGEKITRQIIDYITSAREAGIKINGISDETCKYIYAVKTHVLQEEI